MSDENDIESRIQRQREEGRKNWDHPISFILAAVGSAVGLGNVWRFPYLVSKYGGAPFLIPYFLVLFLVGMPILGMELSIGTFFQAGDADAFGSMNPRLRGIGMASVFGGYSITFYYTIILAWAGVYFIESFQGTSSIPWVIDPEGHFDEISMSTKPGEFTGAFNWKVFISVLVMWLIIWVCIFKGVKSTGWVVKFTVPLPLLILVVLIIRGAFLEGAGDGIMNYLFKADLSALKDSTIWAQAIGQVFFSLGVCMGVMTAYSSHNKKNSTNVPLSEKAISLSDTGIALLGGFAIYEMLGHMQHKCIKEAGGDSVKEAACNYYAKGSMGLAFIAYPEGMSTLEAPQFWGIVFFGCLILLGIDSAFSLVETMVTVAKDSWIGLKYRPANWLVVTICCVVGFLAGLLYVWDCGLVMLDIIDFYINQWGMVLIGMLECFAVGWVYQIDKQYAKAGKTAVVVYNSGFFFALLLGTILALALGPEADQIKPNLTNTEALGIGLCVFFFLWFITIVVSMVLCENNGTSNIPSNLWAVMGWHGPDKLRRMANNAKRNVESDGKWKPNVLKYELQALYRHDCFAITFGFLIKYFSCCLLFAVSCMNIKNDIKTPYGGYPAHLLLVGKFIFVFMLFIIVSIAIFPRIMYDPKHSKKTGFVPILMWYLTPKVVDEGKEEVHENAAVVGK